MHPSKRTVLVPQPQGVNGVWDLHGRQIVSWRSWDLSSAGVFDRGDGEGIWRGDQHRLVFSLLTRPPMLLQLDNGPVNVLHQVPDAIGVYPAGLLARTVAVNSRYIQVCWAPELYRIVAPHLPHPPRIGFDFFQDPLLRQLARGLVEEVGQGSIDRLLADSLMAALAMRVAQRFAPPEPEPDLPRPRLRRVLDYIEAHLDQDLTLAELAGVACLSPSHLSRSFKQEVGAGPQRYTVRRRVERAKTLLRHSDASLAGVAATVGFADQSHFTAAFRRETGMTPGRYRAASA
jgi:AraC family transcriptional regulator